MAGTCVLQVLDLLPALLSLHLLDDALYSSHGPDAARLRGRAAISEVRLVH
jgi:hypothetical protein